MQTESITYYLCKDAILFRLLEPGRSLETLVKPNTNTVPAPMQTNSKPGAGIHLPPTQDQGLWANSSALSASKRCSFRDTCASSSTASASVIDS